MSLISNNLGISKDRISKFMFSNFRDSKLLKGIIHVASGNSVAQIIVLLAAPVITRIYSPEIFGIQGVFLAAISLLAPIAAFRYPMAIVVAENELEVKRLTALSLVTATVVSTILFFVIFFFRTQVSDLLGLDGIGLLIFFLPIALIMTALQEISNYTASRKQRFRPISIVSAIQSLAVNLARILGGIVSPTANVLISISSIAPGLHAAMLSGSQLIKTKFRKLARSDFSILKSTAIRYREFPIFRTPTDFLNAASQTAPVLLLSLFFTPAVAGLYTLTRSTMTLPSNIIGNAIGTVFYSHFAERHRGGHRLTNSSTKATLGLLLGPGVLLIIFAYFGPVIFEIFFGEAWREAGVYARWVSIATAFSIANVPAVKLAPVINRQGALLLLNVFLFVTRAGAILIIGLIGGTALSAVICYSLVSALGSFVLIITMLLLASIDDRRNAVK